jgi:hypothetical protein
MGTAELLDRAAAQTQCIDALAQVVEVRRLRERHPDHLATDKIDTEVKAPGRNQRDRPGNHQEADGHGDVALGDWCSPGRVSKVA